MGIWLNWHKNIPWKSWIYFAFYLTWPEGSSELFWSQFVCCPSSWLSSLSLTFHIFFFSRTTQEISNKLVTKHPLVKGIQVYTNEGPSAFQRGNNEIAKIRWQNFKNLLLENHWANFNQTWHKTSLGEEDSSLFKWNAPPFSKGR